MIYRYICTLLYKVIVQLFMTQTKQFIEKAIQDGRYAEMYDRVRQAEAENKENLLEYQEEKPGVIRNDNVNDILAAIRKRKQKEHDRAENE